MRTGKEIATIVAKAIGKINNLTKGIYAEEKLEVIKNVCESYNINANHIIKVGEFNFNKPK